MNHRRTKFRPAKLPSDHYLLRLFVVGNGPNSKQALSNLRRVCREHLDGRCTIEIVDVLKDFAAAARANILVTPPSSSWRPCPA